MIPRTRFSLVPRALSIIGLCGLGCLACESFVEAEGSHREPHVGTAEAQRDMDDELCWQEIGSEPGDDRASIRELHAECMRAKGWTEK